MRRKIIIIEQSATTIGGHYFMYTTGLARALAAAGQDVAILTNKRMDAAAFKKEFEIVPTFSCTWGESEARGPKPFGPGNFAFELTLGLHQTGATRNDVVIVHTSGYVELKELLQFFASTPPENIHPYFHILLRYDPQELSDNWVHYRPLFSALKASSYWRGKVFFHSDTKQLSSEFGRIIGLPFGVSPIPFDQELLFRKQAARAEAAAVNHEPLNVVYLGDARIEKGYTNIPDAVAYLWKDYIRNGRIRLTIQSNFNTQGGEPGIADAKRLLSQYGLKRVTLLHDALDADAYYDVLASADIVMVPYSAERYRFRSSGVLVEAMTAGVPIVTTKGSWMESMVSPDHAVVYSVDSDLGPALAEAIEAYDRLRAGALARQREAALCSHHSALAQYFLDGVPSPAADCDQARKPLALLVGNGDAMVLRNGAASVIATQLRYLDRAGYRICLVLTATNLAQKPFEWKRDLCEALTGTQLERIFLVGPGPLGSALPVNSEAIAEEFSIASDLREASQFVVGIEACRFLRDNPPDFVLLNYITNYPLVAALGLEATPIVCEMHDIQSFQKAIYGRRQISNADLDLEFSLLEKCQALLSLNDQETQYVLDRSPDMNVLTNGVVIDIRNLSIDFLAGIKDIAELVSATRPMRPEIQYETAWITNKTDEIFRLFGVDSVDILFVGSSHLPNSSGLRWFLEEVYGPYLAEQGVVLFVAGSVCQLGPFPAFPNVFYLDRVDDLTPLYAATKVVILPLKEGAGSPVKTFEAMSYCKPIVATAAAVRGVSVVDGAIMVHDLPHDFASAVLSLLASRDTRLRAARASYETATHFNTFATYSKRMNSCLGALLGDKVSLAPVGRYERDFDGRLVEWGQDLKVANRLIRAILSNERLEASSLNHLIEAQEMLLPLIAAIVETLFQDENLPVIRSEKRVVAQVAKGLQRFSQQAILDILTLTISDKAGSAAGAGPFPGPVMITRRAPATIVIQAEEMAGGTVVAVIDRELAPEERERGDTKQRWRLPALVGDAIETDVITLSGPTASRWRVSQPLPLAVNARMLGIPLWVGWQSDTTDGGLLARLHAATAPGPENTQSTIPAPPRHLAKRGLLNQLRVTARCFRSINTPHPLFDAAWYATEYRGSQSLLFQGWMHFLLKGMAAGFKPNAFFEPDYFATQINTAMSTLEMMDHYLRAGVEEGIDPSPAFSTAGYLNKHPDVANAGLNPLFHFLLHGRDEGRTVAGVGETAGTSSPSAILGGMVAIILPELLGRQGETWLEMTCSLPVGATTAPPLEILVSGQPAILETAVANGTAKIRFKIMRPRERGFTPARVDLGLAADQGLVEYELRLKAAMLEWTSAS